MGNASTFSNTGNAAHCQSVGRDVNLATYINNASTPPDTKLKCFIRPDINFVGRRDELNRLKTGINHNPHIIVISGLGGVGKTQLVRKFIEENKSSYSRVLWINARSRASIEKEIKNRAKVSLNISIEREGEEHDFDDIARNVYAELSQKQSLIVLDNVDKQDDCMFALTLRTLHNQPHVIITSRFREWLVNVPKIDLDVFNVEDALQYISITLNNEESEENDPIEDRRSLVEKLQRFPLALRQATAYIIDQRVVRPVRIVDYITEYNKLLHFLKGTNEYTETTLTTWKVTLAAIEKCGPTGDLALRILRIMAFFDPDHIRREIFFNLELTGNNIEEEVISAVRLLVNYSMVNSKKHQSVLSVHRIVQQVIRLELANDADMMEMILRDGLRLIWKLEKAESYSEVHEHSSSIFLSAVKFYELIEEFPYFSPENMKSFIDSFEFDRVINFGNGVLVSLTDILGLQNLITIDLESSIAYSYNGRCKCLETGQLYQEVYKQWKKIAGEDRHKSFTSKRYIVQSFIGIGKHSDALRMYEEVYEQKKNLLGEDHHDTLATKYNIAKCYSNNGKHSEALKKFQEVYERRKNVLGGDHPSTLITKHNVAHELSNIGKHSEAIQMFQEVYERRKNVLGGDHTDTLESKNIVAHTKGKINPDSVEKFCIYL